MKHYFVILFLFINFHSYSQLNENFAKAYKEVAEVTIGTDIKKALKVSDSLISIAQNNEELITALMLNSTILRQTGNSNKAIQTALKAETIASSENLYEWNAKIGGFLSTQYREAGLKEQGKIYLERAMQASKNIKDFNQSLRFQGNLHQELAYYEMDTKNYKKVISYLQKGNQLFAKMDSFANRNYFLATNAELMGKNYLLIQKSDSAEFHYLKGINLLNSSAYNLSPLKGFLLNGMGNISFARNENEKAYQYYQEALKIADDSDFSELKFEVYNALLNYYKTTGDHANYISYNEKYLKLIEDQNETKKASANNTVEILQKEKQEAKTNQFWILIISATAVIIILFVTIYTYRRKRKKDYQRFKEILKQAKSFEREKEKNEANPSVLTLTENQHQEKEFLTKETEEKLLYGLERFEKSTKFLEKTISLSALAGRLETNTKYLSHVINKHKKKDFSNYINELRIYYIIQKLENDPLYSNYKISYLAEECGYSSHSKFTTTFKSVTGISPSTFLSYLAQEKAEFSKN